LHDEELRDGKADQMRKIIAALQVSVDGFIEGPNGELDGRWDHFEVSARPEIASKDGVALRLPRSRKKCDKKMS
jgi:hypothetical protein